MSELPDLPPDPFGDTHDVRLQMIDDVHSDLWLRANYRGLTIAEYLRRAVSLQTFLEDQVSDGYVIEIRKPDEPDTVKLIELR